MYMQDRFEKRLETLDEKVQKLREFQRRLHTAVLSARRNLQWWQTELAARPPRSVYTSLARRKIKELESRISVLEIQETMVRREIEALENGYPPKD